MSALDVGGAAPRIEVRDLRLQFEGADGRIVPVLDRVSFTVPAGQFVAIVGPSGCGKSTLLRVLSGLAEPAGGGVTFDGEPAARAGAHLGFMFQRDTLLPWATVTENIRVGAELAGLAGAQADARVAELVAFLRLSGFEGNRPHQLSGGMRQRVALGRLLAYEPAVYLMDEPFGALDSQTKVLMGRELLRIWSARRRTILFVTHDIEEAVSLADRVIVLSARPARVALDVAVTLPRPRERSQVRGDPRFGALVEKVWAALDLSEEVGA